MKQENKLTKMPFTGKRIPRFYLNKIRMCRIDSVAKLGCMKVFGSRTIAKMFERISRGVPKNNKTHIRYLASMFERAYLRYCKYYRLQENEASFNEFTALVEEICKDEYGPYLQGKSPFQVVDDKHGKALILLNGKATIPLDVGKVIIADKLKEKYVVDMYIKLMTTLSKPDSEPRDRAIYRAFVGFTMQFRNGINPRVSSKEIFTEFVNIANKLNGKEKVTMVELPKTPETINVFKLVFCGKIGIKVTENKSRFVHATLIRK